MERELFTADPQARLAARLRQHLAVCGVAPETLPATRQLQATAPMVASLMGDRAMADQLAWVSYALIVNVTDALLDRPAPARDDLAAVAALAAGGEPAGGHLLFRVVRAAREAHPPRFEARRATAWLQAFCAAQLRQRTPAESYLEYLENRVVAQGVPLLFQTAAALLEPSALDGPGLARRIALAGTITGLLNDLASYEQELHEGVADSANARGILASVTGLPPRHDGLTRLIEADIAGARRSLHQLLHSDSPLDQLIERVVILVEHSSRRHPQEEL